RGRVDREGCFEELKKLAEELLNEKGSQVHRIFRDYGHQKALTKFGKDPRS
ncbi:hypothetical protein FRX31_027650, partial [Thalictrum thalictroides]